MDRPVINGKKVVLVVEDDKDILNSLSAYFTRHGFQTIPATNGQEALSRMNNDVDIALIDFALSDGMNGLELREGILAHKRIPVILITAMGHVSIPEEELKEKFQQLKNLKTR